MYKGTQVINYMEEHLGEGGAKARAYCGLSSGDPWCDAEVSYALHECKASKYYCGGTKQTSCPTSIKWCYNNLANLPIYLALPGDIVFFDWEPNRVPNHVGFARERKSDVQIMTVEGNTSGGIIDNKIRTAGQVQGCFRPLYPVPKDAYDASKKLTVDGLWGWNTTAVTQKILGISVDAILGQGTVKAIQKKVGATADGDWGAKTTKAMQRFLKKEGLYEGAVDGYAGAKTVKGWQRWLNEEQSDYLQKWFDAMKVQYDWSKDQKYNWVTPTIKSSKTEGTCVTFPAVTLQRMGLLKSRGYFYINSETGKITGRSAGYVLRHPEIFKVWYPNKRFDKAVDDLQKGDIIAFVKPYDHIMVYMGKNKKGDYIFNTMGSTRGLNRTYPYYTRRKVNMVVRLLKTER